jgi:succinate dehydrogenase / fumarate reductase cytochrome b subunit
MSRTLSESEFTGYVNYVDNGVEITKTEDLYLEVSTAFKQWWLVLFYVIAMGALSFHLIHGFQSAFQTLGWNHSRYKPLINFVGIWIFSVAIPLGFVSMPLFFLLK